MLLGSSVFDSGAGIEVAGKDNRASQSPVLNDVNGGQYALAGVCPPADLVASRYNHAFLLEDRDQELLFNAASGALVVVDGFVGSALRQGDVSRLPRDAVDELVRGGFLIPKNVDELLQVRCDTMALWWDRSIAYVVVAPTMQCNFECPYCFETGVDRSQVMSEETARRTISFIQNVARDVRHIGVGWFGGEPLLALKTVLKVTDALKTWATKRHIGFSSTMTTNRILTVSVPLTSFALWLRGIRSIRAGLGSMCKFPLH